MAVRSRITRSGTSKTPATSRGSGVERTCVGHDADDGRDREPRARQESVERADDVHGLGFEPNLLVRLAQRRIGLRLAGCETAAGQADLSGVILEMRGALREQHRGPRSALEQRQEHGRGSARPIEDLAQRRRHGSVDIAEQSRTRIAGRPRCREATTNDVERLNLLSRPS